MPTLKEAALRKIGSPPSGLYSCGSCGEPGKPSAHPIEAMKEKERHLEARSAADQAYVLEYHCPKEGGLVVGGSLRGREVERITGKPPKKPGIVERIKDRIGGGD